MFTIQQLTISFECLQYNNSQSLLYVYNTATTTTTHNLYCKNIHFRNQSGREHTLHINLALSRLICIVYKRYRAEKSALSLWYTVDVN